MRTPPPPLCCEFAGGTTKPLHFEQQLSHIYRTVPLYVVSSVPLQPQDERKGKDRFVLSVAYSPDGRLLACGAMDGTVRGRYMGRGRELKERVCICVRACVYACVRVCVCVTQKNKGAAACRRFQVVSLLCRGVASMEFHVMAPFNRSFQGVDLHVGCCSFLEHSFSFTTNQQVLSPKHANTQIGRCL